MTLREKAFVREYLVCGNATKAAVAAGFSQASAAQSGYRLLKKAHIQSALNARTEKLEAKADYDAMRVLQERINHASFSVSALFDADGNPLPPHKLPASVDRSLAGLEIITRFDEDGRKTVATKYRFPERLKALDGIEKQLEKFTIEARSGENSLPIVDEATIRQLDTATLKQLLSTVQQIREAQARAQASTKKARGARR